MDVSKDKVFWLTLLFRGSKLSRQENCIAPSDEYVAVFEQNGLAATNLPILEFSYKNLDHLQRLLQNLQPTTDREINGLIVTSPRVVEAVELVLGHLGQHKDDVVCRFDERFVFAVGEKSAKELESRLGLSYNLDSTSGGSGGALADHIRTFCDKHTSITRINLIYPKGSLSDETIENNLRDPRINLNSIVVYETTTNKFIESDIVEHLRTINIPEDVDRVVINHTFFSPSGVDAFRQIDSRRYKSTVQECLSSKIVEFCYSAIGKTTEAALIHNRFEVLSVAEKPNATCLLTSLKDKIHSKERL